MKLVINTCFGAFEINPYVAERYDFDRYNESRTNKKLIKLIELGVDCNGSCSELRVVDIPDEATDYKIIDQDGAEEVIYVIDGKIKSFSYDDFFYDEGIE